MKNKKEKKVYKKKIVAMVKKIKNLRYLEFLYKLLLSFKKKWGV